MKPEIGRQHAEAIVFVKEQNMPLRYRPNMQQTFEVRNCSDALDPNRIVYEEGIDYMVDAHEGFIRRTQSSRIPDWSRHVMYGIPSFDHSLFADCSNRDFTVYVDYSFEAIDEPASWSERRSTLTNLERWIKKLRTGEETRVVVLGDSISAGGEASEDKFMFFHRFIRYMNGLYPNSPISLINKAIGGETSDGGRHRIHLDVVPFHPDLVIIGYGMNDQNQYKEGIGVTIPNFEHNLCHMIQAVQLIEGCDLVLVTPCAPNPKWQYVSGLTGEYADVIRRLGTEYQVAVADVHTVWQHELAAGKSPECLLLNNINHPNDYGHELYYKAFLMMLNHSTIEGTN